jgi:hypothetical protein
MKTSNKILLGLLVIVFTVPFLLASSLKSKMKKGEYTVQKNENTRSGDMHSGSFTAFKVVKVLAPGPDFLSCHLKLSQDMNYRYYNDGKDSVKVFTSNDTLYINYVEGQRKTDQNDRRNFNNIEINVNLPAFNNLVVDGAVVIIDSLPASPGNLSVTLKNNGVIKDGSENRAGESAKVSPVENIETEGLQASETHEAEVSGASDIRKPGKVQNARLELLDRDMRDLLIYGLLFRI